MQYQYLLFGLAVAPALVSSWALAWYSNNVCTSALGYIDSSSSSLTKGDFDSNVLGVIVEGTDEISLDGGGNDGNLLGTDACVKVKQTGVQVTWKYWG